MYNISKKIVAVSLITALIILSFNTNAFAQIYEPTAAAKAVDILLARPLGIASQALGCVFFVVSLPFSLPGQNVSSVFKKTIVEPAKFTWTRPVGTIN
ncbi:MAG: hypothetical protein JRF40_04780 [Deltaproteobacteria bacterium]|nr:hypothetical protein [Deltaproteobacteria bacterium]MBW2218796.1 hypothetical protein [Deltaproteobacteria bacterium]